MTTSLLIRIQRELPFSGEELLTLIATAQYRYKVYRIPKRKPNEFRTIAQPSSEIKLLQRWLIRNVLSKLPVHRAATAYREGQSIAIHASRHAAKRFLLKMDFQDFFHSISAADVERRLIEALHLTPDEARVVSQLVCWKDRSTGRLCLSIGAPSSPILSNALLYEFDKRMTQLARERKAIYSRYADDLAFSTNRKDVLKDVARGVQVVCAALEGPQLRVNSGKTVFTSRAYRRTLVGLNLTPGGAISLGREKKRQLRSALYRFARGQLLGEEISALRGQLAFAWSVEKTFVRSMVKKFGPTVFEQLQLPFGSHQEPNN